MSPIEPLVSIYIKHDRAAVFEKNDYYLVEITEMTPPNDASWDRVLNVERYETEEVKSMHYFFWMLYRTYAVVFQEFERL